MPDELERAGQRLQLWRDALASASPGHAAHLRAEVRDALADDLNAPAALSVLDSWAAGWHDGDGSGADPIRRLLDACLGVEL
jgi:L-cysteine:1D-myo-inositol 2-amino-2-deoxy-alpha-D-glucopyranoside ligase